MKKPAQATTFLSLIAAVILMMTFTACSDDDSDNNMQTSYTLKAKDVLGVTGTVVFRQSGSVITIEILMTGAPVGSHPAELRQHTIVEGGETVLTLNPVDSNGMSTTVVTTLTYSQLITYDGYIQIGKSADEPGVILGHCDIGGNVLTSTNKTYALQEIGTYGVSGTALFEKRVNNSTLVTISLTGTLETEDYPASINLGSIATVGGGPVTVTLGDVKGSTGKSYTNIRALDNSTEITYENWLVYDGYINIYQDSISNSSIICHGNIGSNN